MGDNEIGVCCFCHEEKQVVRTYLYPSRYEKPENLADSNKLYNQGSYFTYLQTCFDCGEPEPQNSKQKMNTEKIVRLNAIIDRLHNGFDNGEQKANDANFLQNLCDSLKGPSEANDEPQLTQQPVVNEAFMGETKPGADQTIMADIRNVVRTTPEEKQQQEQQELPVSPYPGYIPDSDPIQEIVEQKDELSKDTDDAPKGIQPGVTSDPE